MRISDWSSDVCSSDLAPCLEGVIAQARLVAGRHMLDPDDHVGVDVRLEQGGGDAGQAVEGPQDRKEHTSELQSLMRISYAVFCLKKKKKDDMNHIPMSLHTKHTSTAYEESTLNKEKRE